MSEETTQRVFVSGFDQIREKRDALLEVELGTILQDGKPWVVRLKNVRPIDYYALGKSIPIPAERSSDRTEWSLEEQRQYHDWMVDIVCLSIDSFRECYREEIMDKDGEPTGEFSEWQERWLPVKFADVPDHSKKPNRDKGEISWKDFDWHDNVERCHHKLLLDNSYGGELGAFIERPFRPERTSDDSGTGKKLRRAPARNRARKTKRAGG